MKDVLEVAPIVADYVKCNRLAVTGKKKETRLRNASQRDKIWNYMTTDAQWLAVEILSGHVVKYTVAKEK